MFISHAVIGIVFRLLNFSLLIVLVLYLFKKYGKPVFIELLAKKDAERELLLNEQSNLEKKQSELQLLIMQEVRDCEKFKEKIDLWKRVIDRENSYYGQEFEKMRVLVDKKMTQRAQQVERKYIRSMVLKKLIPKLHHELSRHFKQEHNEIEYTDAIVKFMDEGKQ